VDKTEERAARQRLTEIIRKRSPDGISPAGAAEILQAEGHNAGRSDVSNWILDMRSAGLVESAGCGGWRTATEKEREGPGEALRAAIEKWDYEFTPHPIEQAHPAIRDLFAAMATRTVMTFTPREFASFCDELLAHRLVLHEVTRVPHFEPETVL
jgi:hypothetical protein